MAKSKRGMRRVILSNLFDHLLDQYGIDCTKEEFLQRIQTIHEIDAFLAFKSDTRLTELYQALQRVEDGTFGFCMKCKGAISQRMLEVDPVQRFCMMCETVVNRALAHNHANQSIV